MIRRVPTGLWIVLAVACCVRVLAWLTLPLIVTNDGAFYLFWGGQIAQGHWPDLPATRTPGYPILLGGVTAIFGASAATVVAAQHALGVVSVACAWKIGSDIAGQRAGLLAGLAIAVEPWLLGLSSYALADAPATAFVLASIALVSGTCGWRRAGLAGVTICAAALLRPSLMAWWPGVIAIAAAAGLPSARGMAIRGACVLAGILPLAVLWIGFNLSRGVPGMTQTDGLALWGGLARAHLLDPEFEVPDPLAPHAARVLSDHPSEDRVLGFFNAAGHVDGVDRSELLGSWSRSSIAANPFGYARAVLHAAAWQSNAMFPGTPYRHDGLRWMMRRLGGTDAMDGRPANFSTSHDLDGLDRFRDTPPAGPLAWGLRHWPVGMFQAYPHVPLGVTTLALACVLAWRRRWQASAVLIASFPIVAGHALLLQPFARYSISAWMIWWIGGSAAVILLLPHAKRLVRHPLSQRGGIDR